MLGNAIYATERASRAQLGQSDCAFSAELNDSYFLCIMKNHCVEALKVGLQRQWARSLGLAGG